MVLLSLAEALWTQAFKDYDDLDAVSIPESAQDIFDLALDDHIQIAVAVLQTLKRIRSCHLA